MGLWTSLSPVFLGLLAIDVRSLQSLNCTRQHNPICFFICTVAYRQGLFRAVIRQVKMAILRVDKNAQMQRLQPFAAILAGPLMPQDDPNESPA